jgi:glycosyltransferase involved in cell wall biosynthesis
MEKDGAAASRTMFRSGRGVNAPTGLANVDEMNGLISVVVPTYDREDALDAVLRGLSRQTDRRFEVVIADDGSGPKTAALIRSWVPRLGMPLRHVRHEHAGFRAAEIRNRAILAASGDYFVFLDGDCIPRPDFIAAHRALAEPGWFITGNRTLLSQELTARVLAEGLAPETWGFGTFLRERLAGRVNRLAPLAPLPLGPLRKLHPQVWQGARSANLGVWAADLKRVDGFDARFSGWGLEDSDLLIRLMRAGVRRKDGRFATGVLHLWHPPEDRSALPRNQAQLDAVIAATEVRAQQGLSAIPDDSSDGGHAQPGAELAHESQDR